MTRICLFFCGFVLLSSMICAQSVQIEAIKKNPNYYWGEGEGNTISRANQGALSMLSDQISVSVESSFEVVAQEELNIKSGKRRSNEQ